MSCELPAALRALGSNDIFQQLALILLFFIGLFSALSLTFPWISVAFPPWPWFAAPSPEAPCPSKDDMSNQEQIAQVAFCLHKLSGNLIIVGFAGQKSIFTNTYLFGWTGS